MSQLKIIYSFITLFISPYYIHSFPDAPPKYVTQKCREKATGFNISTVPLAYNSALFCMYQNLRVLQVMQSLNLSLTTPHTGRSICRIQILWFNETSERVNMAIYDTDLKGNCTFRNNTIVKALADPTTKQLSELKIPRKLGRSAPYLKEERARLLFTDYEKCLIFITPFFSRRVKYCELFVVSNNTVNMHDTPCHSIYRIYCGYGRPTRDVWPNPAESSSDEELEFEIEAHQLRMLIEHTDPLKEDTIFMNEFRMIPEVLYHIPEANVYSSTTGKTEPRLCGIQTYKIMPDMANLNIRLISPHKNETMYGLSYYQWDKKAVPPTKISLLNRKDRTYRMLLSNFKNCYVLKKVGGMDGNKNRSPSCELFVKNNTNPITDLEVCWFVFLAYCGYPKAFYNETSCYSDRKY
uniref:Putative secreted protein n=1 Tax=Ixodes ricinus TaxID=34613 RepID=A0A147BTS5_IXORI